MMNIDIYKFLNLADHLFKTKGFSTIVCCYFPLMKNYKTHRHPESTKLVLDKIIFNPIIAGNPQVTHHN